MSIPSRQMRQTTLDNSAKSLEVPFVPDWRKILPENSTATIKATTDIHTMDLTISKIKAVYRLKTFVVHSLLEILHKSPLNRGKTHFQGSRAVQGHQAAHACLYPSIKDNILPQMIQKVVQNGLTPTKTEPFLKNRLGLTSPEVKILQENHNNLEFVTQFILERLPHPNAMHSILAGTRYEMYCNTTFENPDACNQFDTRLENELKPFLKELQTLRLDETDTAEDSMTKFVEWLIVYYTLSIKNLEDQMEHLLLAHEAFQNMRTFELSHLNDCGINEDEFEEYLGNVKSFLEHYDFLITKKIGTPRSAKDLRTIRNDFSILRKMIHKSSLEEAAIYYQQNTRHLGNEMVFNVEAFYNKCALYKQEAEAQLDAMNDCSDPCVYSQMLKGLFGVVDNGIYRLPSEDELHERLFALSKLATPVKEEMAKKQIKRDAENTCKMQLQFETSDDDIFSNIINDENLEPKSKKFKSSNSVFSNQ